MITIHLVNRKNNMMIMILKSMPTLNPELFPAIELPLRLGSGLRVRKFQLGSGLWVRKFQLGSGLRSREDRVPCLIIVVR